MPHARFKKGGSSSGDQGYYEETVVDAFCTATTVGEGRRRGIIPLVVYQCFCYLRIPVIVSICVLVMFVDYEDIRDAAAASFTGGFIISKRQQPRGNNTTSTSTNTTTTTNGPISFFTQFWKAGKDDDDGDGDGGGKIVENHKVMVEDEEEEDTTLHFIHTAVLDLLDWELESLSGIVDSFFTTSNSAHTDLLKVEATACNPPNGIDDICCLGAFSAGGGVGALGRYRCATQLNEGLDRLQQQTKDFFRNNPLPSSSSSSSTGNANGNVMECDVCRIVELAHTKNLTIVLLGDSMHSQMAAGISCELQRRNYIVQSKLVKIPRDGDGPYQRKHGGSTYYSIRSPEWSSVSADDDDDDNDSTGSGGGVGKFVTIVSHTVYMAPLCPTNCGDFLELTANADVLVLGLGLHWRYNIGPSYRDDMEWVFQTIQKQDRVKLLVHRETSAQHFDGDGGAYEMWVKKKNHSRNCTPIANKESVTTYWREQTIAQSAQQLGMKIIPVGTNMPHLSSSESSSSSSSSSSTTTHNNNNNNNTKPLMTEIISLPYYQFTAQFPRMHPDLAPGTSFMDCTHYCGSPYMYYPLWRSLRLAMDNKFAPSSQKAAT